MRCTACGFENVTDASFCGDCGASLTSPASCPACGRANPPKQKFCNGRGKPVARSADRASLVDPRSYTPKHLAEKILTSRSALEGERKQVTVLADVKGGCRLAHGAPLLILPMHRILDQLMVGRAVAAAGAGRVLPKTASADEIRSAVRSLLQDPSYRRAAEAAGTRLRSRNGAIAAAEELEGLLRIRKKSAQPAA